MPEGTQKVREERWEPKSWPLTPETPVSLKVVSSAEKADRLG